MQTQNKFLFPSLYINRKIQYLKGVNITEYDMKSGGFSILKAKNLLTENQIKELELMPKEQRNIAIGKIEMQNQTIMKAKNIGFKEYITRFIIENKIPPEYILSIKKDAVFLINSNPTILQFDEHVNFVLKNQYTSYCNLSGKEFYYNGLFGTLDTKGFGKDIEEKCKNGILKDIKTILDLSSRYDKKYMFNFLKEYRSDFLNKKLPVESFRDLDTGAFIHPLQNLDFIAPDYLPEIDTRNTYMKYILELIKIIL